MLAFSDDSQYIKKVFYKIQTNTKIKIFKARQPLFALKRGGLLWLIEQTN